MKKDNKKSLWFWVLAIINLGAVAGLLISYLAAWIKPAAFWPIAFFGLAYPLFFLINLVFVFHWIFRKRWFVILSLSVIALGWNTHLDYIRFSGKNTVSEKEEGFKIISYNAHLFKPIETNKYDKKSKQGMLEMLLKEKVDILCFQEFYTRSKGVYDIKDSLIKRGDYKYFKREVFASNGTEELSMAIFSKFKIINFELIPFHEYPHANMATYADVLIQDDTVRIINIHLQSINFQPEDYLYLNKIKTADPDMQSSKRIGARLKNAFITRSDQAETVREAIDDSPYPVIVCGDFNDTPASYAFHVISNGLKNSFREKGSGIGITYNGAFPNFQIDYILCSPKFQVLDYKIIPKKYSDHFPVVSHLKLAD